MKSHFKVAIMESTTKFAMLDNSEKGDVLKKSARK